MGEFKEEFKYCNLREENATLKKQVADYDDFVRHMNKRNQEFIGETIKQLIENK